VLFQAGSELTAYDLATGKVRWSYAAEGLATVASPVVAGDKVLTWGKQSVLLKPTGRPETPEVAWTSNRLKAGGYATPVFYQDRIYSLNGEILQCGSAADGKVIWDLRLKGPISASPVAAEGRLYIVNEKGVTQVVQLGDKPEIIAENNLGDLFLATPAIANGVIFLRSDKMLYCIGKK
jgi:outer membrane protein assembly factor BamB